MQITSTAANQALDVTNTEVNHLTKFYFSNPPFMIKYRIWLVN